MPESNRHAAASELGLSLVELLVAMAIGLFVVATATWLITQQLREHRQLLLEARLLQDLRTTTDLVTRNLRRAGYWGDASAGLWRSAAPASDNPYIDWASTGGPSSTVMFRYSRDASENHLLDSNESFGFRLHQGAVQMRIGGGQWQAMTDAGVIEVTALTLTPIVGEESLEGFCARPCPPASTNCPPRHQVRSMAIRIEARATRDHAVVRSLQSQVRLRNDAMLGQCPA